MDYEHLLLAAQRNSEQSALLKRKNLHNDRCRGPDPSAVAAFKARKEREERERIVRAQQEKNRLLSLRAQNSKSVKKALMMKSRTKDNDFGKITITDEDRRLEEKIKQKSIHDTKERMKARIDLDQRLTGLTRKEKDRMIARIEREEPVRITTKQLKVRDVIEQNRQKTNPSSKRPDKNKPMPPSYDEILNMASEKSQKKISLEEEIKAEIETKQTAQKLRAMTQKEKERHREEQFYKSRSKKVTLQSSNAKIQPEKNLHQSNKRKLVSKEPSEPISVSTQRKFSKQNNSPSTVVSSKQQQSYTSSHKIDHQQYKPLVNKNAKQQMDSFPPKTQANGCMISKTGTQSMHLNNRLMAHDKPSISIQSSKTSANLSSIRSKTKPPNMICSKSTSRPKLPVPALPPIGATYRRGIYDDYDMYQNQQNDDDSYYEDDEMDEEDDMADFIDDGPLQPEPEEEYSKHIREIFGYDKRKYRNMIEDDVEVASYGQVMKEEMRSLREGIKEDLEDIKREEQEKRLKMLQKKAKMKGLKGY